MRLFILMLALVLWLANIHICDLLYPDNTKDCIRSWWKLRTNIYGICIALVFQASVIGEKDNRVRFVLDICTGLALSNVIDRWLFDIREFRYGDVLMIAITLGFALKRYYNARKRDFENNYKSTIRHLEGTQGDE